MPSTDDEVRPPGKNWPQGFYKRHPELKARRVKALDWNRHDNGIYDKVVHWFALIGRELHDPAIRQENVYNMDETGVLLSVLGSLKVLTGRDDLNYRGVGVKRTLITAIECISADGRSLHPLIIWPAATHRSTWTTYPTPGWHFACSQSGYTDTAISLYWIRNVFDPQTRARANNEPRILISDGSGTHESLEVMIFCYENNIILCRLPSHTSHKLQPCDVGVFGPLKTANREQVEQLYRGGVSTIGKQHFSFLYSRAREMAFTRRNIQSCWSKTGLFPFNPDRVLGEIKKPQGETNDLQTNTVLQFDPPPCTGLLQTPTTSETLSFLRNQIEQDIHGLDGPCRLRLQKLGNAAENAIAERALLFDDNRLLFAQNNEKAHRQSTRSTVIGNAKVMSYDDIVEAQQKRDAKEGGRVVKRKCLGRPPGQGIRSRAQEVAKAEQEINTLGLANYCSVLQFS